MADGKFYLCEQSTDSFAVFFRELQMIFGELS